MTLATKVQISTVAILTSGGFLYFTFKRYQQRKRLEAEMALKVERQLEEEREKFWLKVKVYTSLTFVAGCLGGAYMIKRKIQRYIDDKYYDNY